MTTYVQGIFCLVKSSVCQLFLLVCWSLILLKIYMVIHKSFIFIFGLTVKLAPAQCTAEDCCNLSGVEGGGVGAGEGRLPVLTQGRHLHLHLQVPHPSDYRGNPNRNILETMVISTNDENKFTFAHFMFNADFICTS